LFSFVGSCTPYPARTVQIDAMEGAERTGLRRYAPVVVLGSDWERFGVPFVKEVESNPSWVSLLQEQDGGVCLARQIQPILVERYRQAGRLPPL